jgi:hypothetical protein
MATAIATVSFLFSFSLILILDTVLHCTRAQIQFYGFVGAWLQYKL